MNLSISKNEYTFRFRIVSKEGQSECVVTRNAVTLARFTFQHPNSHVPLIVEHIIRDHSNEFPSEWIHIALGYLREVCQTD